MEREFTYTKAKLRFILSAILDGDIRTNPAYLAEDRAEEGFEKRAAIEFLLWFLEHGFPEGFSFAYRYTQLEDEYSKAAALRIAHGQGWSAREVREREQTGNVVFVDFRKQK